MAKPSLFPLFTITFVLFLSLAAKGYQLPELELPSHRFADFAVQQKNARATFSDVLNLLGTADQAASVDPQIARELRSCFQYLVPPPSSAADLNDADDEQIWYPPDSVIELVNAAFQSGGNPQTIVTALNPTPIPVPDIEGAREARCSLTRRDSCQRFASQDLNNYMNFLFNLIVRRGRNIGLNAQLNRFDFFHGHLIITKDSRIGILYHAKEYPVGNPQLPSQGYCDHGSTLIYDASQMNLRNILWLAPYITDRDWAPGTLLVLDARPGGIVYNDLIADYEVSKIARTLYEGDIGTVAIEPNYLNVNWPNTPQYQLFMC